MKNKENTIEILADNLGSLFENTRLTGKKTYEDDTYEVWEVNAEDLDIMDNLTEERFYVYCPFGWYRHAIGSNMEEAYAEYNVNGHTLVAWDGCEKYNDSERVYGDIIEYLLYELGASTETNVCALLVDLARYNHMKMSELLTKYRSHGVSRYLYNNCYSTDIMTDDVM